MGSPTLANAFMCYFENIWLENCPSHFKPIVYRQFVDDTFLLFRSKDHVEKLRDYLNKQHKKIYIYIRNYITNLYHKFKKMVRCHF